MPNNCMVINCTNREGKNGIKMYRIPTIRHNKGSSVEQLTEWRQRLWLTAINRSAFAATNRLSGSHRVCSEHFVKGKPASFLDDTDVDWVPTLKLGNGRDAKQEKFSWLQERKKRKEKLHVASALLNLSEGASTSVPTNYNGAKAMRGHQGISSIPYDNEVARQSTAHSPSNTESTCTCSPSTLVEAEDVKPELPPIETKDAEEQTDVTIKQLDSFQQAFNDTQRELVELRDKLCSVTFDEAKFKENEDKCHFYTGLCWESLTALVGYLSPALYSGRNSLTKFQEILLVLIKLKLGLQTRLLGDLFNIDQATVSRIFLRVLHVMCTNLKFLIHWPEKEALRLTLPSECTKYFGNGVTVIIDCFEIIIDRPSNLKARSLTYSHNKSVNTIKYLIGMTPQGAVSYISPGWGGRTSDRYIVENSDFFSKLETGDLVLADRSFNVHESMGQVCADLKVQAFTKGETQLTPFEVDTTRKLSQPKIHMERVIESIRNKYTLLQTKIPIDYLITANEDFNTLDQIVTVCACLVNLNKGSVPFS